MGAFVLGETHLIVHCRGASGFLTASVAMISCQDGTCHWFRLPKRFKAPTVLPSRESPTEPKLNPPLSLSNVNTSCQLSVSQSFTALLEVEQPTASRFPSGEKATPPAAWIKPRSLGSSRHVVVSHSRTYREVWAPLHNFFLPSMKLVEKSRVGSRWRRKHDRAQTAYQRLWKLEVLRPKARRQFESLDPFVLHEQLEKRLQPILAKALEVN